MTKPKPQYRVSKARNWPADEYGGYGIVETSHLSPIYDHETFDKDSAKLACKIMNEIDPETWNELRDEMERRGWIDPLAKVASEASPR